MFAGRHDQAIDAAGWIDKEASHAASNAQPLASDGWPSLIARGRLVYDGLTRGRAGYAQTLYGCPELRGKPCESNNLYHLSGPRNSGKRSAYMWRELDPDAVYEEKTIHLKE